MTGTATELPGYLAGTWTIDPAHSDVAFSVRHLMISTVRGHFTRFHGEILTAQDPLDSRVDATIDLVSIDTGNPQRDQDLRSANYLDVATHPEMTYRSTSVRRTGDGFLVQGELSLHQVTRPVPLALQVNGFTPDPFGDTRAGFSATAELNRRDFGITTNMPMDGGGVVIGDTIQIVIEIEAILQQPAEA
jgi:polyisoprenoid-binding protein YceI